MSYATVDDLAAFLTAAGMGAPPANAQLLLDRATRLVTRATQCAVYGIDSDGNPTDPDVTAAFKTATLEHVAALIGMGVSGVPNPYQTVTAGRISLGRGTTSSIGGDIADGTALAPQALMALAQAGLANQEPWVV